MTEVRDDRYRRRFQIERDRADRYRRDAVNLAAALVVLSGDIGWLDMIDADDRADARSRIDELAGTMGRRRG